MRNLPIRLSRSTCGWTNQSFWNLPIKCNFFESIPAKPYPREDAVQIAIEDLVPTIPKLKEMKVSDFIDVGVMKEIENAGFFVRIQK